MIAVTGITGHTGSFFLHELVAHQYTDTIRCFVREKSDTKMLDECGLKIEKVVGTLDDLEAVRLFVENVDTVVHIANIKYSSAIVKTAHIHHVRRVILVHTTGVFSKYKMASEEYKQIEEVIAPYFANMKITVLHPTMIFGDLCDRNIRKFIRMVDMLPIMPVINRGENLLQPVNARDLGKAYYQVFQCEHLPENIYILSGERAVSMHEPFEEIGCLLGKKVRFLSIPLSLGVWLCRVAKLVTLGRVDYVERMLRMGENRDFAHAEATRDFAYQPELFSVGLAREVKAYMSAKESSKDTSK